MTDPDQHNAGNETDAVNHRARTYERPDFPYRCGRERLWSSPCGRGPNPDGSCGGVSECLPTRQGDRWRCSRPIWAGGPCVHGPKPDGGCYTQRPPCRPQSSSRAKRRRAGWLAAFTSLAVIAAFFATSPGLLGFDRNLTIPGPLTAAHAHLIDGRRCELCHEGHQREGLALAKALVDFQDMTDQSHQCHEFEGQSRRPHNMLLSGNTTSSDIGCMSCHTEHKGQAADISAFPDADCHSCHKPDVTFQHFSDRGKQQHPPLPDDFGGLARSSIRFDHDKHLNSHFKKPEVQDERPSSCAACHVSPDGNSEIVIPSFESGCAGCHEDQIKDEPLFFLTWPEMETMQPPADRVSEDCRIDEPLDLDDFEPASFELPTLLEAFLLGVDPDDIEAYEGTYQKLGERLATEGVQPLADLVRAKSGDPELLLAGLSPELVVNPACSWIANQEYEGFEPLAGGGWFAGAFGLSYRPAGHADPIMKAWFDLAAGIDGEDQSEPWSAEFKASLFHPETGPGRCAACHTASDEPGMVWTSKSHRRRHTVFSHEPHLAIEQAAGAKACSTCHIEASETPRSDDFQAIDLGTCQQCHRRDEAGEACALCHRYHPLR
jgi:hypothetical protein